MAEIYQLAQKSEKPMKEEDGIWNIRTKGEFPFKEVGELVGKTMAICCSPRKTENSKLQQILKTETKSKKIVKKIQLIC